MTLNDFLESYNGSRDIYFFIVSLDDSVFIENIDLAHLFTYKDYDSFSFRTINCFKVFLHLNIIYFYIVLI